MLKSLGQGSKVSAGAFHFSALGQRVGAGCDIRIHRFEELRDRQRMLSHPRQPACIERLRDRLERSIRVRCSGIHPIEVVKLQDSRGPLGTAMARPPPSEP